MFINRLQNLLEHNKVEFAKQFEGNSIRESQYVNHIKELKLELSGSEDRVAQLTAQLVGMKAKVSDLLHGDSPIRQIVYANKEIEKHLELNTHKVNKYK
jgi:hypothetical protein